MAPSTKPASIRQISTAASKKLVQLGPDAILVLSNWNERDDMGDLAGLKQSIRENGLRKPLKLYQPKAGEVIETKEGHQDYHALGTEYLLIDGHRRLKVILELQAEGDPRANLVTCLLEDRVDNPESLLLTQIIENDGLALTPYAQAAIFKRLLDKGWTRERIAKRIGRSTLTVSNNLNLLNAPEPIQKLIKKGDLSATTAIQVLREVKPGQEREATQILKLISEGGIAAQVAVNILKEEDDILDATDRIIEARVAAQKAGKKKVRGEHDQAKGKSESKGPALKPYLVNLFKNCAMKRVEEQVELTLSYEEWHDLLLKLGLEDS